MNIPLLFRKIGVKTLHHCLWLPDKLYLEILYYLKTGKPLHLKNPRTYNEKLQWLKLYNRKPEYSKMVDKAEAKKYAESIIGAEHIIPTLGVWNSFDEIDFDSLPDKFVLKTTNGGGGNNVVICKDKSSLDYNMARRLLKKRKHDIYDYNREWPYKNVPYRILAEELLDTDEGAELEDYKFFCFNGEPKIMLVSHGRFTGPTCFDYYDMDFRLLPFQQGGPNSGILRDKPQNFNQMVLLARALSKGLPQARIDLYDHMGKIYFGEITFFDSSGMAAFNPEEWDYKLGQMIDLPTKE